MINHIFKDIFMCCVGIRAYMHVTILPVEGCAIITDIKMHILRKDKIRL